MGRYSVASFYVLSFCSGFLEMGALFWGVSIGLSIVQVVLLGIFFQIGLLVPNPIKFSKTGTYYIALGTVASVGLSLYFFKSQIFFSCLLMSRLLSASMVQSLRGFYLSEAPLLYKRLCRMTGFVLSPLYSLPVHLLIALFFLILLAFTQWDVQKLTIFKTKWTRLCSLVFLHHAHYFCYLYFLLYQIGFLLRDFKAFCGVAFVLGWIFYSLAPKWIKTSSYSTYFSLSHFILTGISIGMGLFVNQLFFFLLFWSMTSFFSGTIFFLDKINQKFKECDWNSMDYAQTAGHIFGCVLSLVIYLAFQHSILAVMITAGILSASAGLYMYSYRKLVPV